MVPVAWGEAASSAVGMFEYLFVGSQVRILFTRTATAVTWCAAAQSLTLFIIM